MSAKPHIMLAEVSDGSESLRWMRRHRFGRMVCFRTVTPYPYEKWGFDNGAFDSWQNGNAWDEAAYKERLAEAFSWHCAPLVAIVPDIVTAGCESLEFSLSWIRKLPRDWPWYLAVQDGMDAEEVSDSLHMFAGIFLGGTNVFKAKEGEKWAKLAHGVQKKFHYGRCGTIDKLRHARRIGADSLDSSYPLWTKPRREWFKTVALDDPQGEFAHAPLT